MKVDTEHSDMIIFMEWIYFLDWIGFTVDLRMDKMLSLLYLNMSFMDVSAGDFKT